VIPRWPGVPPWWVFFDTDGALMRNLDCLYKAVTNRPEKDCRSFKFRRSCGLLANGNAVAGNKCQG
jgi:hypothetical protein